jgi:hypothetical protein
MNVIPLSTNACFNADANDNACAMQNSIITPGLMRYAIRSLVIGCRNTFDLVFHGLLV